MTVSEAKALYIQILSSESSVFSSYDEPNEKTLVITYEGKNLEKVNIYITFGTSDGNSFLITLGCFSLPCFAERMGIGLNLCNELNRSELTKYYLDEEGYLTTFASLSFNSFGITNGFNPKQITSVAAIMAMSIDNAYPMIQNALLQG